MKLHRSNIESQSLKYKLVIMYTVMTVIPVLFLSYVIINYLFPNLSVLSRANSPVVITLVIGMAAILIMSLSGVALMYRSVRSMERLSQKTGEILKDIKPNDIKLATNNETEKLNHYFSTLLVELQGKITQANHYAVELDESNRKLVNLAVKDSLTGLYNHGYIKERLEQEISRAKRFNHLISLMMIDIDDFKAVNDTYGHLVGDHVLRTISRLIHETVGPLGIASRYGGEEFLVLFPETNESEAKRIAENIRHKIDAHNFTLSPIGDNAPSGTPFIHLTCSNGTCSFPEDGDKVDTLISKSDTAVYQAKKNGKNRVENYA